MADDKAKATLPKGEPTKAPKGEPEAAASGDEKKTVPEAAAAAEGGSSKDAKELTRPPNVPRPNFEAMKSKQDIVKDEKKEINKQIKALDDKIKKIQAAHAGDDEGLAAARAAVKTLRADRDKYFGERTRLYDLRDAARESRDAKMSEMKDLKSQTKFKSVGEIDGKIKALETKQSTTSLSLKVEKDLLKEVDDLKKQRKILAQHSALAEGLDGGAGKGDYDAQIKDVNDKLTKVKTEMEKHQSVLNKAYDKQNNSEKKGLEEEKEKLYKKRKEKDEEVQAIYNAFLDEKKVFEANQKLWDEFIKEEKKARSEAYAAEAKARAEAAAAELAAKTPYEEEMLLCDYLANYLTTTFLNGAKAEEDAKAVAAAAAAGGGSISGEFAGMTSMSKKGKDEPYMAATGKKGFKGKKGGGGGKKGGTKGGKIVMVPETFESFGLLKMEPPTTIDKVAAAVEALKKKKAEFEVMPRGQIKSIAEINHELSLKADSAKPRREDREGGKGGAGKGGAGKGGAGGAGGAKGAKGSGGGGKQGGGKGPNVDSKSDFPALGGGKPPAAPAAAAAAAAPEEETKA